MAFLNVVIMWYRFLVTLRGPATCPAIDTTRRLKRASYSRASVAEMITTFRILRELLSLENGRTPAFLTKIEGEFSFSDVLFTCSSSSSLSS